MDIEKIKVRWNYAAKVKQDEIEAIAKKANTKAFEPMVSRDRKDVWELIEAYEKITVAKELKTNAKEAIAKPPQGTNVESKDSKSHDIPKNG